MNCETARQALDARFALSEEPVDDAALDAHLATCAECRARGDRLARVDAALEGGGLGPGRVDALEARLLARVAGAPTPAAGPVPRRARWPVFALAAGALAAAALLVVVAPWQPGAADDYTPRGVAAGAYGVRAFCVGADGVVVAEARSGETLACGRGEVVQFTATAPQATEVSVWLEGTQTRLFPGEGASARVEAGVDVPLPSSTPVGEWLDGPRQVVARFVGDDGGVQGEATLTLRPAP